MLPLFRRYAIASMRPCMRQYVMRQCILWQCTLTQKVTQTLSRAFWKSKQGLYLFLILSPTKRKKSGSYSRKGRSHPRPLSHSLSLSLSSFLTLSPSHFLSLHLILPDSSLSHTHKHLLPSLPPTLSLSLPHPPPPHTPPSLSTPSLSLSHSLSHAQPAGGKSEGAAGQVQILKKSVYTFLYES